jgi:hypothetical protein
MKPDTTAKPTRAAYVPEGGVHIRYNQSGFVSNPTVTVSDPVLLDSRGYPLRRAIGFQPPTKVTA